MQSSLSLGQVHIKRWTICPWVLYSLPSTVPSVLISNSIQTTSKHKLLERENKVIRCFELAGDLTLLYLQVSLA